jgi:catechol 2,3-dioxygenase-like lactoylglutathione lyase family enzyme
MLPACFRPEITAMPLTRLEHYLVLTDDVDATRDFYRDVLGLVVGKRADLGFAGYWLYLGEVPVIHIAEWASYTSHSQRSGIPVTTRAEGTGSFDHVAFNGSDADEMIARLDARGIPYHRNDVPVANLVQLFLYDPNGVKVELNYR